MLETTILQPSGSTARISSPLIKQPFHFSKAQGTLNPKPDKSTLKVILTWRIGGLRK